MFSLSATSLETLTFEDFLVKYATLHESLHIAVIGHLTPELTNPYSALTATALPDSPDVDLLGVFIACLKTDRLDGLYTTVVCDESGVCLGLVYSNATSIRAAVIERKGIYWSRSRGGKYMNTLVSFSSH